MSPIFEIAKRIIGGTCIGLLTLPLLSTSCSQKNVSIQEEIPDFIISCVAVSPAVRAFAPDSELSSAIEKKELEDGIYFLNKALKNYFISSSDVRLASDSQLSGTKDDAKTPSLVRAKEIAERLSCNAVLETTLHRYRERVGGTLTAKKPASVAFSYRLLAMPDGKVLCQDKFDAEQQSIISNLLSLSSGTGGSFTWLTAKDFLTQGLENRLNACSYLIDI